MFGSTGSRDRNTLGCWLGKRLLGNLPLCLCLLGPPCVSTSPSFVVLSWPPHCLVLASQLCNPSSSEQPPPTAVRLSEAPAPPPLSLPFSGPLPLPISPCLPYPPAKCLCLSVCLPERPVWPPTDEAGIAHPAARSSRDKPPLMEEEGTSLPLGLT